MSVREAEELLQKRAERLVANEVYCHVGGLIDDNKINDFYSEYAPTDEDVETYKNDNDIEDFDQAYDDLRDEFDPLEFWAVSEWLMDKLQAEGEAVITYGLTNVWARQTSGQAIAIDYVIETIVQKTNYASSLEA